MRLMKVQAFSHRGSALPRSECMYHFYGGRRESAGDNIFMAHACSVQVRMVNALDEGAGIFPQGLGPPRE